ncbi:MAG TPA: hypothetical protein VHX88_20955 [Solirubrobacteraceae bacterium]|jgi:hypothetical protein|nr:hypothetical protein [Solirubrobacteraceae bacterium]
MLDSRIYRAALPPIIVAVIIAAFSLSNRPAPLTTSLAPDVFSGPAAMQLLSGLVGEAGPPGGVKDQQLASSIATDFTNADFPQVRTYADQARTIDGERSLDTVVAVRPGTLNGSIVLMAHRDVSGPRSEWGAELSGTAALLELAQTFGSAANCKINCAGRIFQHTIVLVSTSGGTGGNGGASAFVGHIPAPVDAALVLGDVAGTVTRRPFVLPFSDGGNLAPQLLQRTLTGALQTEAADAPGEPDLTSQFVHLALPLTLGEQGVLNKAGLPAVLLQVSGERGPTAAERAPSENRMSNVGQGALRALNALDSGLTGALAPSASLVIHNQLLPEWPVRLLVLALLGPVLLAAVDGLARAGRRREPLSADLIWALSCAVPFLLAGVLAELLRASGALTSAPSLPVPPGSIPVAGGVIAALIIFWVLGWLLRAGALRITLRVPRPRPGAAGVMLTLVLALGTLIVWALNPYAALLLVPAAHLTLLVAVEDSPLPRPAIAGALLLGLLAPAAVIALHAHELSMSFGQTLWMVLLLVAGGYGGVLALLLGSLVLGVVSGSLILAVRPRPVRVAPAVTVRGPVGYAGPGSLGGTESALRR